jgi:hypothetical protein
MKINMLTRVRKHFNNDVVSEHINRHNMRAWVLSVRFLTGESKKKWLLSDQAEKLVTK